MWSTIFTAASTVLGRGASGSRNSGINIAEAMAAYDFPRRPMAKPQEAVAVGGVGPATQYNELLSAWDNYLNNEYLELSKRIFS